MSIHLPRFLPLRAHLTAEVQLQIAFAKNGVPTIRENRELVTARQVALWKIAMAGEG